METTIDLPGWEITQIMHEDCPECAKEAHSAVIHARVTGSIGATSSTEQRQMNGEVVTQHSATVQRRP